MTRLDAVRPTLYLDVDGVILPFGQSPFEMIALNGLEGYAPEVVRRLGNTCLNLVWSTSWGERELATLIDGMDALRDGRKLAIASPPTIASKVAAVIGDQEKFPTPFVWIDDAITGIEVSKIQMRFADRPHLIIQPDKQLGLVEAQLVSIEDFARISE